MAELGLGLGPSPLPPSLPQITGPWRSLWIRFGYDPRRHPEAKIYQVLDFRIRCGMKSGKNDQHPSLSSIFLCLRALAISTRPVAGSRPPLGRPEQGGREGASSGLAPRRPSLLSHKHSFSLIPGERPGVQPRLQRVPCPGPPLWPCTGTWWLLPTRPASGAVPREPWWAVAPGSALCPSTPDTPSSPQGTPPTRCP